jgi:CRP-like cAMP-binding protein
VVAAEDSVLLELQRATFARMFAEHPELAEKLSQRLAQRRSQLHAVSEADVAHAREAVRETRHILARLRHIFGIAPR